MKARRCKVISYTFSGYVIEEIECPTLKKALEERKKMKGALSCYSVVIYDAETMGIIKD